jgi:hypothetical protein
MKPLHLPHYLLVALFVIVGAVLVMGSLHAFSAAHAAPPPAAASQTIDLTPTPTPVPAPTSTDTTGVVALSIIVVAVILFGILWGGRRPAKSKKSEK